MNRKIWALFLCLLLAPPSLPAQDVRLTDFIVTNTREDLLLYMTLDGAFRDKFQKAVLNGVPASISYFVNLERVRTAWPDKRIAEVKVSHTIKYNNLKNEFAIQRSWEPGRQVITQSFTEAQKLMGEIEGLPVAPLSRLEKGRKYRIRTRAEVDKITLPLYLHYVLFFVSIWDIKTDWYTIDFEY